MPNVKRMHQTAYNRTVAVIRDYPRMKSEVAKLEADTIKATSYDAMPKAHSTESAVELAAIRLADMKSIISKIDACLMEVPDDMRKGIMENILYRTNFPLNDWGLLVPSLSKWKREKGVFIQKVAKKLDII